MVRRWRLIGYFPILYNPHSSDSQLLRRCTEVAAVGTQHLCPASLSRGGLPGLAGVYRQLSRGSSTYSLYCGFVAGLRQAAAASEDGGKAPLPMKIKCTLKLPVRSAAQANVNCPPQPVVQPIVQPVQPPVVQPVQPPVVHPPLQCAPLP
jgi:hypothetical protein